MNTCELTLNDHGGCEFGVIMNMIMVLQEAYSSTFLFLTNKGEIFPVNGYRKLLNFLLDTEIYIPNRGRLWDIELFIRENNIECSYFDNVRFELFSVVEELDWAQFWAVGLRDIKDKDTKNIKTKEEIKEANHFDKRYYLKEIFDQLFETDETGLYTYLKSLFECELEEREKLAKDTGVYGDIATVSLYMLPAEMIGIYACSKKEDFWKTWDGFGITGYKETKRKKEKNEKGKKFPLYELFRLDDEDKFIYLFGEKELQLSDEMKARLEQWKQDIKKVHDILRFGRYGMLIGKMFILTKK